MNRREIIAGLGSAAAWPLAARAQQPAVPVVGFLSGQSAADDSKIVTIAVLQGLNETGYVEGKNVAVEYHYAENQYNRLPALAADLVHSSVAVIITVGTLRANVTGIANLQTELGPKRLQLLRELMPNTAVFGVLADQAVPGVQSIITDLQAAARTLGLQLVVVNARTDSDLETAFATLSQQHVGAVLVGPSAFYNRRMEQLAALTARHALPAIYPVREFALAGGLMSYGSSAGHFYHQAGIYAGRILKGEKPADLPVQQITKIDLVINLKTAKALGLTVPETLLATADEVIQ